MSEPVTPTDDLLAKLANGDPYLIIALRQLFDQAGTLSPSLIEEALLAAGNAGTAANQANASIEKLADAVTLLAHAPQKEGAIIPGDLSPINVVIDKCDDLSPVADQVGTDNSTNVTLAGAPDYITIVGQVITRALINLTSHVTGLLPLLNGGTGDAAVTAANIGHLKTMDQDVATTDDPTFDEITATTGINLGGTAAENLLDFYKTGTFTPVIADATSGGNTATIGSVTGDYTKIGDMVTVKLSALNIDTTGMTAGNVLYIRDLPFTSIAGNRSAGAVILDKFTFTNYVQPSISASASYITLVDVRSGLTDVNLLVSSVVSATSDIASLTIQYKA